MGYGNMFGDTPKAFLILGIIIGLVVGGIVVTVGFSINHASQVNQEKIQQENIKNEATVMRINELITAYETADTDKKPIIIETIKAYTQEIPPEKIPDNIKAFLQNNQ